MSNTRALFESIQTNLKENYSIEQILDSRKMWNEYVSILRSKLDDISNIAEKYDITEGFTMATLKYHPVYQNHFTPRCPYMVYRVRISEEYNEIANKTAYKTIPEEIRNEFIDKVNSLVNDLRAGVDGIVVNENDSNPIIFAQGYLWIRIRLDVDKIKF